MRDNRSKPKIIFKEIFLIFGILLVSIYPIKCLFGIIDTITLANNGIFTTAIVLEHRITGSGKYTKYEQKVSYDNCIAYMSLKYSEYPINCKVPVVYLKDDPGKVLVGNFGDTAWELYKLNNNIFVDGFFTIFSVVYFVAFIRDLRHISTPKKIKILWRS